MNKRGIALILGFTIIVVLIILSAGIVSSSISERVITQRSNASLKAFWAAEAGVAKSASQLPTVTALSEDDLEQNSTNRLQYDVLEPTLVEGYTDRWMITSTGRYILNQTPIERRVVAIVEIFGLTSAIETTGDLNIGNNVTINGTYEESSSLIFEDVFGMSKDAVKALVDPANYELNPGTNWQPTGGMQNDFVWVDVTGNNKYVISSDWSGSGLLIVDGSGLSGAERVALDISGGTFTGLIWVIGKLSISGNPTITGALFAESGADVENKLTGTATLTFSSSDRDNALALLGLDLDLAGVNILSWQEQAAY